MGLWVKFTQVASPKSMPVGLYQGFISYKHVAWIILAYYCQMSLLHHTGHTYMYTYNSVTDKQSGNNQISWHCDSFDS